MSDAPQPDLKDVCPKCHALYTYRRDENGTLVREMCRTCHPEIGVQSKPIPFIAFTGLAQSGKTTCARHLKATRGFGIFSFAGPLKAMLEVLAPTDDKEATPSVLCGKSVREALQTLGTEWGRRLIGDDIWIRAACQKIERMRRSGDIGIANDDCRFDNEAALVRKMGGMVISLERPGATRMNHASEAGISLSLIDAHISATDVDSLLRQLEEVLSRA